MPLDSRLLLLADRSLEFVQSQTGYDAIVCDETAKIVRATVRTRLGSTHAGAQRTLRCEVEDEQARERPVPAWMNSIVAWQRSHSLGHPHRRRLDLRQRRHFPARWARERLTHVEFAPCRSSRHRDGSLTYSSIVVRIRPSFGTDAAGTPCSTDPDASEEARSAGGTSKPHSTQPNAAPWLR